MAVVYKWSWIGYFGSVCLISDIFRDYWLVLRSSLVVGYGWGCMEWGGSGAGDGVIYSKFKTVKCVECINYGFILINII